MPISDSYIVRYLLQTTRDDEQSILWRQKDCGRYVARLRDIELEIENIPSRAGSRLHLTLSSASEKVQIAEPPNIGFIGSKYRSDDQEELARLMQELAAAIARQCSARRARSETRIDLVRQTVYRRLIDLSESEI